MRNRKKEQALNENIIRLRIEERRVKAELKQNMIDLYIAMGFTIDQAVKMV